MSVASCVILVPAIGDIAEGCRLGLRELERMGYEVRERTHVASLDTCRADMLESALRDGFDELMWINGDISFSADDVRQLREHALPCVVGLYPQPFGRKLACAFHPETEEVKFGGIGGLLEVRYSGLGFALIRREVFDRAREWLSAIRSDTGPESSSLFAPLTIHEPQTGPWQLDGDFSFCERARQCGFQIMADTRIRLWRVAAHAFGWEDAGGELPRFDSYLFRVTSTDGDGGGADQDGVRQPALDKVDERTMRSRPPRDSLHETLEPLSTGFPRLAAYVVSYAANDASLRATLQSFRESDWGVEPKVFLQPESWPICTQSAANNYRRALEAAVDDECDFALIVEDDVRVARHLRHALTSIPLVTRDQCDYFSLFMPDLIASPWERQEPHLGYRLAKPLYTGPNNLWEKHRLWGAQAYLLSRRLVTEALKHWDRLAESQDTRIVSLCSERRVPMWYSLPCLVQHAPLKSAFATPIAFAADFDPHVAIRVRAGYQPPEAVPGWLSCDEGGLLWELADRRHVLELGTNAGRGTVCLAQQARSVVSVDVLDQGEAREWVRRYGLEPRVEFRRGEAVDVCRTLHQRFDLVFLDMEHDAESLARDLEALLPLLARGALVAVHDYPDPDWPEVRQVVDRMAAELGWRRERQVDYLGVFAT